MEIPTKDVGLSDTGCSPPPTDRAAPADRGRRDGR
jgi:hypothetical protein